MLQACSTQPAYRRSSVVVCTRFAKRCAAPGASYADNNQTFIANVVAIAAAACLFASPSHADEETTLSFNKNCIGCHVGGGNVVQAGATLREGDLKRNGVASVEAIYDLVYNGRQKMPGYGTGCTPKGKCTFGPRLSDEEIQRLSQYVVEQAAADWK
ncbi:g6872 [Coccomyxa elongata]